jgi:hypothetical protein
MNPKVKVYKDQTGVKLIFRTFLNFETDPISTAVIKYIKPNKEAGQWQADIQTDSADGDITFDFSATNKFDLKGKWKMRVEGTYVDSRTFKSRWVIYYVSD